MENGEIDFFLGAGASVSSGIPSGGDLVWYFKRLIYCNENSVSTEKYKDLYLRSTRDLLQNYFDSKGIYPKMYDSTEYSHYFQECYPLPITRQRFIDDQVSGRNPSLGYLCLADLICKEKIKNIWTTNFDALTETALNIIAPLKDYLVCSSANSSSISNLNPKKPCVCKLHGDFRYDTLQNTSEELQSLEFEIYNYWLKSMLNKGLVVIGYSGNDDSIMTFLETHIHETDFLSKGIFWTKIKDGNVSPRVEALLKKANENGKIAENGMNSLNHYAYGSILEWIYKDVLGISPILPGFRKAKLSPHINYGLKKIEGEFDSAVGKWEISWNILSNGDISYSVIVPFGATAELTLPYGGGKYELESGEFSLSYTPNVPLRTVYSTNMPLEKLLSVPKVKEVLSRIIPQISMVPMSLQKMSIRDIAKRMGGVIKEEMFEKIDAILAVI